MEMVSDYNAYVLVGGSKLWMNFDTMTATTWVMSAACFTEGCKKTPLFAGMFIPIIPAALLPLDLFQRGIAQEGGIKMILGHSVVRLSLLI
jgi:hypothetical protein